MFHGAEEEGYHKACQCAAEEGYKEQEGEIAQHHGVAEGNHGGADLPDIMARRACDGHAIDAQFTAAAQQRHNGHGEDTAQEGEQERRGVACEQRAQKAAGDKNHKSRPCAQVVQGEEGHNVGKTQLHTRQGDKEGDREEVFQCT